MFSQRSTMPTDTCCGRKWGHVFRILDSIVLVLVVGFQGTALNYFMIQHEDLLEINAYLWFIGDVIIVVLFIVAVVFSNRFFLKRIHEQIQPLDDTLIAIPMYGVLPFGYITWFFYSILLIAKVIVIFKSPLTSTLRIQGLFSTITLKIALATSVVVFILLVNSHHDAEPNSERSNYIADLCQGTAFDLFDSIDFLSLLLFNESHLDQYSQVYNYFVHDTVISLSCLNFILPSLSLIRLSLSDFGGVRHPLKISLLVKTLKLICINFPYMLMRIYLYQTDDTISLFLFKNILYVAICLRYMFPEFVAAYNIWCRPPRPTSP